MIITELNILEFGGMKERVFTLSEGLNLFEGENEAGKSTVWLFIKFMLYGLPKKGQEERLRSVSRDGHCAKGTMRVRARGEEYVIERSFVEGTRGGSERVHVFRVRDGQDVLFENSPGEMLLGVPKEVFESSCGIGQSMGTALGGKKSMDAIRNLLSTADERVDVSKIIEKLDRVRVTYRYKNGKGGRIPDLEAERNRLMQQHEAATETQGRLSALRTKLSADETRIASLREQQAEINDLLTQIGYHHILCRFDRLAEDRRLLEQVEQERKGLCGELKTEYFPTVSHVATLQNLVEQVEQAETKLTAQRKYTEELVKTNNIDEDGISKGKQIVEMGGSDAVLSAFQSKKRARNGMMTGGVVCLFAGVLSLLLLPLSLSAKLGILGALATAGVLLALFGLRAGKAASAQVRALGDSTSDPKSHIQSLESAYRNHEKWEKNLLEAEAELRMTKGYLDGSLSKLTARMKMTLPEDQVTATAERGREEIARLNEFLKRDSELSKRKELLSAKISEEERQLVGYDAEALRTQVSPGVREMTAAQIGTAELSKKMIRNKLDMLESSIKQTRIEEISLAANAKDPLAIADELSSVREKHRRALAYGDSLELAISALTRAADTMSGSITPALSETAGAMMEKISGGRYGELRTGNELTPTLFGEGGQSLSGELMSGGTKDAAYLCLRIALMTQVFTAELPPLMMDESLCQMDDSRVEHVLSLLSTLCGDGLQCLLFTCHKREGVIASERGFPHQHVLL